MAFHAGQVEIFGPTLKNTTADVLLVNWERKREGQWQLLSFGSLDMPFIDECVQTIGDEIPERLSIALLHIWGQCVLFLTLFKIPPTTREVYIADPQVGTTHVYGQDSPFFAATREV